MSDEVKQEQTTDKELEQVVAQIKVTDKEKEEFFKAMLADKPFTQTIKLLDGKLSAKFKTLTITEQGDIHRQIALDQDLGIAKNDNQYFTKISQYRLGLSLLELNGVAFGTDVTPETIPANDKTTYVAERAKLFDSWQVPKLAGVLGAFREFDNKVLHMTNMMEDPNFWKAAV